MREIIIRNIDNAPNGKEFFAGISGNFKDFGQTLCELIDNPISNFRAHKRRGRVEIVLEEQGDYVDVSVRDNGTGIENMDAALTIAARSCAESTLNEHGMGLKHALASINAGEDQHWSIQTRTAEDVANDRYQRAEGPYDIHMPVSMIPGSGEVAGGTGTVVRVRCPMHKFLTLKPASKKEEPTFGQMAAYLRETLRYTYANLLRDKAFIILFTAIDKNGASDSGEIPGALEPNWRDGQMTELPRSIVSAIRRRPYRIPRRRKTACGRTMRRWRRCSAGSAPTSLSRSRRRDGSRCWCVCLRRKSRRRRAFCGSPRRRICISA